MFSILDGRAEFFQWDIDRKLIVNDSSIKEVHFCNKTEECSLVVATYKENELTLANVPNILLQTDWKIRVYGYTGDFTKYEQCFKVNKRSKPSDYVYTETEVLNYDALLKRVEALEQSSGDSEALTEHINANNPHKITPELIKALNSQAKRVDSLDTDAMESGVYTGITTWAQDTEFLCLTLTAPDNRVFQLLIDEFYNKEWFVEPDYTHTTPQQHPTVFIRYYNKVYEDWFGGGVNLDILFHLRENYPTYEKIPELVNIEIEKQKEQLIEDVIAALPIYNGEVV